MRSLSEVHAAAREHEQRRGWSRGYPDSPMIDERFRMRRSVKRAMRRFRRLRPFRLRKLAFVAAVGSLYRDLAEAYDMPAPELRHVGEWEGDSGSSTYGEALIGGNHLVTLRGRESVLTALHEFAHARGYGETAAVRWSVNVFRLTFPCSFERLENEPGTHVLRRPVPLESE